MFDFKSTKTFVLEFNIKVSCLNNCVSIFEARSSVSKRCDTTASYHFWKSERGKKRLCNVKQPCWCLQILLLEVLFFFFNFFRKPVKRELDRVQWSFVISECMHAFPPAWVACSHCSAVSKLVGLCLCINHKWFQCYWNQQSIKVHLANPRWWAQWLA